MCVYFYSLVQFSTEQEGFDHGVANAKCGFFNVLEDFPSIGGASMEWVRAEGQEPAEGKAVVSKATSDCLCMRLLQMLHVFAFLQ